MLRHVWPSFPAPIGHPEDKMIDWLIDHPDIYTGVRVVRIHAGAGGCPATSYRQCCHNGMLISFMCRCMRMVYENIFNCMELTEFLSNLNQNYQYDLIRLQDSSDIYARFHHIVHGSCCTIPYVTWCRNYFGAGGSGEVIIQKWVSNQLGIKKNPVCQYLTGFWWCIIGNRHLAPKTTDYTLVL